MGCSQGTLPNHGKTPGTMELKHPLGDIRHVGVERDAASLLGA